MDTVDRLHWQLSRLKEVNSLLYQQVARSNGIVFQVCSRKPFDHDQIMWAASCKVSGQEAIREADKWRKVFP